MDGAFQKRTRKDSVVCMPPVYGIERVNTILHITETHKGERKPVSARDMNKIASIPAKPLMYSKSGLQFKNPVESTWHFRPSAKTIGQNSGGNM